MTAKNLSVQIIKREGNIGGSILLPDFSSIRYPELVFGIAGPIGIDMDGLCAALTESLHSVGYQSKIIKITEETRSISSSIIGPVAQDFYSVMKHKMDHASAICRDNGDPARLMRLAINAIRKERGLISDNFLVEADNEIDKLSLGSTAFYDIAREDKIKQKVAFIVRQIKRPDEVSLMRNVYGKQFILISAYGSETDRREILLEKIRRSKSLITKATEISSLADDLIERDMNEEGDAHGQHLRDAFHLADVFVDGISKSSMQMKLNRFINALFGLNEIAPSKTEYGMYAAKAASLRSSDLSRQVGAAVFSEEGEIIAQGCNEVPKAFGGTYWDTEEPDFRDIKLGHDPNDVLKREVLRDLLERLQSSGLLSDKAISLGESGQIVDQLTKKVTIKDDSGEGCLRDALILDLTEYGRVVHAEMSAICDAARNGRPLRGAVLFCTTFPCHNCTKHILAAGIKRVFFMEPYPKSRAKELHYNEIELDKPSSSRVSFLPFMGIAPYRYRDLFEKSKRKDNGLAKKWYYDIPRPMIDVQVPNYTNLEKFAMFNLIGDVVIVDQQEEATPVVASE